MLIKIIGEKLVGIKASRVQNNNKNSTIARRQILICITGSKVDLFKEKQ
jgi:hypothetical protein